MNEISQQQQQAGNKIIDAFCSGKTWVMECAQMQSGKTGCYLFTSCEMLRRNMVQRVIIFSGTADLDLKHQLIAEVQQCPGSRYFQNYASWLRKYTLNEYDETELIKNIKENIQVVWGSELLKYNGPTKNCLFIWEESHFGQSIRQRPDQFLQLIGISANGETMTDDNNLLLSVSATPFSEFSDLLHHHQKKEVVFLEPGNGYYGVQSMIHNQMIHSFTDITDALHRAFSYQQNMGRQLNKKYYSVIRCKNTEKISKIANLFSFRVVEYNSLKESVEGRTIWQNLDKEPHYHTVIVIKDMCRMGKNLEKNHIIFVMETTRFIKTDTALQGLLGRVCGYSSQASQIQIYLHHSVIQRGELESYVEMFTDSSIFVAKFATNIKKNGGGGRKSRPSTENIDYCIPIIFRNIGMGNKKDFRENKVDRFIQLLEVPHMDLIVNPNSQEITNRILRELKDDVSNEYKNVHTRNLKTGNKTYDAKNMYEKIITAFHTNRPLPTQQKGQKFVFWNIGTLDDNSILHEKDVVLLCALTRPLGEARSSSSARVDVPCTNGREVFCG
jgi:hypothetical protein